MNTKINRAAKDKTKENMAAVSCVIAGFSDKAYYSDISANSKDGLIFYFSEDSEDLQ